jgi:hypothetical protein
VRPAGDDAEFGLQVDLVGVVGCQMEDQASGVVDEFGSGNRSAWNSLTSIGGN